MLNLKMQNLQNYGVASMMDEIIQPNIGMKSVHDEVEFDIHTTST